MEATKMNGFIMTKKDQITYRIIEEFRLGNLKRWEAAERLGISERTISRKTKKIREKGIVGIKHGNYGKIPHNKIGDEIKEVFLNLYKNVYSYFNYSHALEMIETHQEMKISYTTFKNWCRGAGIGKIKRRKTSKARVIRERSANEGYMLLMDGSPDKWNGKDKWTLISTIDDATSEINSASFFISETTLNCMKILRHIIETKGLPSVILTDKAGWAGGERDHGKRTLFTQFSRVCEELGIILITTPSPQSKGRIERSFRTIQDRLIAEMRLYEIKGMADANRYLEQVFLPEWNEKFAVEAVSHESRYRPLPKEIDLDEILCMKYQRQINRDHTVHFEGKKYKINPEHFGCMWRKEVSVHVYENGTLNLFYGDYRLKFEEIKPVKRRWLKRV